MQTVTEAAEDWVRRKLKEEGASTEIAPALIAIAQKNKVLIERLIWWIQDAPKGKEWSATAWRTWVRKYIETAAALERAQDLTLCPHCHAAPAVPAGDYMLCPNGCAPVKR